MKYVVVADGLHDQITRVVEAPNPLKAVAMSGISPYTYDDLHVYQLARKHQPVAEFTGEQTWQWEELSDV